MPGKREKFPPTTTVSPARLRMCQPTQRPTYRTGEWIATAWGRCRVTGRFGQRHQDLLDACLWNAELSRDTDDGAIEILVDPARVRKTMSKGRHSLAGIQKLIKELREVTLEMETPKLKIVGGLLDHVVKSQATRLDPVKGGYRHLWRVRLGLALVELLRNDLPLHYDPAPIARLKHGISQAVARHVLTHADSPNGGWSMDGLIRTVAGNVSGDALLNRRRELRADEPGLAMLGIVIVRDRVFHDPKACSTRPVLQGSSGVLPGGCCVPLKGPQQPPPPALTRDPPGGEGTSGGEGGDAAVPRPGTGADDAGWVDGRIRIAIAAFRPLLEFLSESESAPDEGSDEGGAW